MTKLYAFNESGEIVVGCDVADADEMLRHARRWNKTAKGWRVVTVIGDRRAVSECSQTWTVQP
jgi:hypothetical protein